MNKSYSKNVAIMGFYNIFTFNLYNIISNIFYIGLLIFSLPFCFFLHKKYFLWEYYHGNKEKKLFNSKTESFQS